MPRPGPWGHGRRACRQGGTAPPITPPGDPGGIRVTPSLAPIQASPTRIGDLRDRCPPGSNPPPVFLLTPANLFGQSGRKLTDSGVELLADSRTLEDRARKIDLKLEAWRKKRAASADSGAELMTDSAQESSAISASHFNTICACLGVRGQRFPPHASRVLKRNCGA